MLLFVYQNVSDLNKILILIHSVAKINTKPCKLRSKVLKFYWPTGPVQNRFYWPNRKSTGHGPVLISTPGYFMYVKHALMNYVKHVLLDLHVYVMLCYCFTPYQRLWLYNGTCLPCVLKNACFYECCTFSFVNPAKIYQRGQKWNLISVLCRHIFIQGKKNMCVYGHMLKKIMVGWSEIVFF